MLDFNMLEQKYTSFQYLYFFVYFYSFTPFVSLYKCKIQLVSVP